jgi:hypothetical protein
MPAADRTGRAGGSLRLVATPRARSCKPAQRVAQQHGSSNRVVAAILVGELPSLDAGEITDKGSINQRAVLRCRAPMVADLYAAAPPPHVIVAGR